MPLRTRSILSGNPPKSVALHTIASCLAPVSSVNSTFFLTHECPLILSRPISVLSTLWLADRKSTCLNSSHSQISYAVFCLKKKKKEQNTHTLSQRTHSSKNNDVYAQHGITKDSTTRTESLHNRRSP